MKTGLAQTTTKSAKTLAQQIARQIAQEPIEIVKDAGAQVSGTENIPQERIFEQSSQPSETQKIEHLKAESHDAAKSTRTLGALQREIEDIRKYDVFKDLQEKISQGIEVPLTDFPELSMEQKEVLKAQMEAVSYQKKQQEYSEKQTGGSLFGSAKKGRRFGSGQKQEAEKQQTRVEKPVPPSG